MRPTKVGNAALGRKIVAKDGHPDPPEVAGLCGEGDPGYCTEKLTVTR